MKKIYTYSLLSILMSTIFIQTLDAYALSTGDYAQNDILYYSQGSGAVCDTNVSDKDSSSISGSGFERLKNAVKEYGEYAMDVQREFGTPWELVLAQMQKESSVGKAGIAVSGAENNWLGITGKGNAGTYVSPSGRKWAKYSSVEKSIDDWAGFRVLRAGYYDKAFAYLDPNKYDLDTFIKEVIKVYAPDSDGNNSSAYAQDVIGFINGPIAEARKENNWPSSKELAEKETIQIGGKHSLGEEVTVDTNSDDESGSCTTAATGDINSTAILFSWPDRTHGLDDPKPEYKQALDDVGLTTYPDAQVKRGSSCDAFVSAVMRSTVDKDFFCCGTAGMLSKLPSNSKYKEITNLKNTSNLQAGDIFILNGHIMMYVILEDGSERIASASYDDRTGDHDSAVYFSDKRGDYRIFRYQG